MEPYIAKIAYKSVRNGKEVEDLMQAGRMRFDFITLAQKQSFPRMPPKPS
jgi:urease gamma subunit